MDGRRFDRLSRAVAARMDRRGLIAALGALVIGGAAARRAAVAQDECPGGCPEGTVCTGGACAKTCREDRQCRDRTTDGCIAARCVEGVCSETAVRCEAGYVCCRNGECCPQPCALDLDCGLTDPCITGRCLDGACDYQRREPCVICLDDADCAISGGTCCNGSCLAPCPAGTTLGKGCACIVAGTESVDLGANTAFDDASGGDFERDVPPTPVPTPAATPTAVPIAP